MFGLIEPDELERRALAMANLIDDELYKIGEDMYTQQLLDEMRGK